MNTESQREIRDIALPSGLVQLEYLESDGGQYIDTGIPVVKNDDNYYISVEIKFSTNSIQNDKWIFGSYNNDIGGDYNYLVGIYEDQWCVGLCNQEFLHPNPTNIPLSKNVKHIVKVNCDEKTTFDDETIYNTIFKKPCDKTDANTNAYLFASHRVKLASQYALPCQIYYCKIWENGTLKRDFIPVKFTNNLGQPEGAMYDLANPSIGIDPDGTQRNDGLYRNRGVNSFWWWPRQEKHERNSIVQIKKFNADDADYNFLGWNRDRFAIQPEYPKDNPGNAKFDRNVKLYGIWELKECLVTFNFMGGAGTFDSEEDSDSNDSEEDSDSKKKKQLKISDFKMKHLRNTPIGELPTATKTGYIFLGWYTEPVGGVFVDKDTPVMDDLILFAQWQLDYDMFLQDIEGMIGAAIDDMDLSKILEQIMSDISGGGGSDDKDEKPGDLPPLYMGENGEHDLYFRLCKKSDEESDAEPQEPEEPQESEEPEEPQEPQEPVWPNDVTKQYLESVGYKIGEPDSPSPSFPALYCYDPKADYRAEIEPKRFLEGKIVGGTLYIPAEAFEWRDKWDSHPEGYLKGNEAVEAAKKAGGWYETVNYEDMWQGAVHFYVDTHWYTNGAGGGYVTHDEGKPGKSDPWACQTFLSNTEQGSFIMNDDPDGQMQYRLLHWYTEYNGEEKEVPVIYRKINIIPSRNMRTGNRQIDNYPTYGKPQYQAPGRRLVRWYVAANGRYEWRKFPDSIEEKPDDKWIRLEVPEKPWRGLKSKVTQPIENQVKGILQEGSTYYYKDPGTGEQVFKTGARQVAVMGEILLNATSLVYEGDEAFPVWLCSRFENVLDNNGRGFAFWADRQPW